MVYHLNKYIHKYNTVPVLFLWQFNAFNIFEQNFILEVALVFTKYLHSAVWNGDMTQLCFSTSLFQLYSIALFDSASKYIIKYIAWKCSTNSSKPSKQLNIISIIYICILHIYGNIAHTLVTEMEAIKMLQGRMNKIGF